MQPCKPPTIMFCLLFPHTTTLTAVFVPNDSSELSSVYVSLASLNLSYQAPQSPEPGIGISRSEMVRLDVSKRSSARWWSFGALLGTTRRFLETPQELPQFVGWQTCSPVVLYFVVVCAVAEQSLVIDEAVEYAEVAVEVIVPSTLTSTQDVMSVTVAILHSLDELDELDSYSGSPFGLIVIRGNELGNPAGGLCVCQYKHLGLGKENTYPPRGNTPLSPVSENVQSREKRTLTWTDPE